MLLHVPSRKSLPGAKGYRILPILFMIAKTVIIGGNIRTIRPANELASPTGN